MIDEAETGRSLTIWSHFWTLVYRLWVFLRKL